MGPGLQACNPIGAQSPPLPLIAAQAQADGIFPCHTGKNSVCAQNVRNSLKIDPCNQMLISSFPMRLAGKEFSLPGMPAGNPLLDYSLLSAGTTKWRMLHQKHALAGGLGIEEAFDIDFAVDDELGAFGLADRREGPGGDDRQLLAQHVGTDVDRHIVAFADKAHRAPHLALRTAAIRPSGWLDVSRVKSAPPWVRSLIAPIGSFERGLTVSQAPNSLARDSRESASEELSEGSRRGSRAQTYSILC